MIQFKYKGKTVTLADSDLYLAFFAAVGSFSEVQSFDDYAYEMTRRMEYGALEEALYEAGVEDATYEVGWASNICVKAVRQWLEEGRKGLEKIISLVR